MVTTGCFCDAVIEAHDDEALALALRDHLTAVHSLDVSEVSARNAIERGRQLGPVPDRLPEVGQITTEPVAGHLEDFLHLFDEEAFTDNIGWASCYCLFHHVDADDWVEWSWQHNRTETMRRIRSGETTGLLAYVDGKVAGWVNASRLADYARHRRGDPADSTTGAIVCFVVAPAYRGHGLARRLLNDACDLLRDAGLSAVEAYPVETPGSAAGAYHGTIDMFLAAGFLRVEDGLVRKDL